jgi:Zn ribbon nucleic-acid-binding protein
MGRFVGHLPCPRCNSKDNMADYTDSYYCFGCGYSKGKHDLLSLRTRLEGNKEKETSGIMLETSPILPAKALKWLMSYGLTKQEIGNFSWNEDRELLVLYQDATYWQGRNFNEQVSAKYLSQGKKPLLFYENGAIVSTPTKPTLVFVEDIVSAVKVSRFATTSPLLGATMPLETILRCLEHDFTQVLIWMDRDKAKESLKASKQASQILGNVRSVITELDPKELTDEEIRRIVNE